MEVGWGGEGGMVGNIGLLASHLSHLSRLTKSHRPQKDILPTLVFEIIGKSHYQGQTRTLRLRCAIL